MTLYALKPQFQHLLKPLVRALADARVTANQITLAAAIGSAAVAMIVIWAAEMRWVFLLLPVWLLLRMGFNVIDGMLAREYRQQSRLGVYLNEICDVVSDAVLYAPIAMIEPFGLLGIALVIFLAALAEFAGVLGQTIGASRRYDGPLGKSDRALVFGVLGFWIGIGAPLPGWLGWIVPTVAVLLVVTVINRVRAGLREVAAKTC
jgi:CDP-diacylglycerol--glycerol-3-phosphate 3-phosphatidyltransferase